LTEQPPSYPPPPPGGYGYPSSPEDGYGYPPRRAGMNGMAVASLVCSLLGWLCLIGPILGMIFGFVALNQIKQTGQRGRGMALAGIIIGGILIALAIGLGILRTVAKHTTNTDSSGPAAVMIVEPQAVSSILAA
jgi:Domain of unknown function (DUF4190)